LIYIGTNRCCQKISGFSHETGHRPIMHLLLNSLQSQISSSLK